MKTKINQQNAQINYWLITPTCFGPSVEAIIREFEILESYKAIVLMLECCYVPVYVFTSRYDSCGMLKHSTAIISRREHIYVHNNILTDQYNGFVTLKDFELPKDGFDWGAETCWSDWSVINYSELICAFRWFIFFFLSSTCPIPKQRNFHNFIS